MTEPVIATAQLHRSFSDNHVLRGTEFRIDPGTITGLLGVNGAGKTTLMHCMLGMIKPDSGTCRIFGQESWNADPTTRQRIGFVPQVFDAFEWMNVGQILKYVGAFYENWNATFVGELIDRFELDPSAKVSKLSVGMRQRVSIVMALGHEPELLVLDEPVAALDPVGRRTFIELLLDLHRNEGKTVLFSTHITSDIERVAARVGLLKDGVMQLHCDLEDLKQSYCRVHLHSQEGVEQLTNGVPGCMKRELQAHSARMMVENLDSEWLSAVRGLEDVDVQVEDLNLDEIFVELNS